MSGTEILGEVVDILVGGITGIAEGIGSGLSALAKSVFITTVGTGAEAVTTLSVFGSLVVVFAGVALAIGLSRFVTGFITSLGSRK